MTAEILVLRLVHVLGGIFWVGSGLFTTFFLLPALGKAGPAAGPVMGALAQRRVYTVLPIVAVLTLLSGARLLWISSGGLSSAWLGTRMGQTFLWSGVVATVAFLVALLLARPAGVRAGQAAARLATAPEAERGALAAEAERHRRRAAATGLFAMVLLLASAAGMAVARYLG